MIGFSWGKTTPLQKCIVFLDSFFKYHLVHSLLGENNSEVQIKIYISKLLSGIVLK